MSKKVIYFNDDEILKGGDMDSVISKTNHNTLLTSNSNIHVGGVPNNNCGETVKNTSAAAAATAAAEAEAEAGSVANEAAAAATAAEAGTVAGTEEGEEGDEGEGEGGGDEGGDDGGDDGGDEGEGEGGGGGDGGGSEGSGEGSEGEGDGDNYDQSLSPLRGGASESTQLNQLVEQLLATNMAKISNQLTSQSGGGLNITDVLSGINEQLSNLNTNIGKIIQLNNKNI
jgi:hypothetical protein